MTKADKARLLRPIIERAMQFIDDDKTAIVATDLYEVWESDKAYSTGKKLRYEGLLYRVLQNHTSQSNWTPDVAVSLYERVVYEEGVIKEWIPPVGSTGLYPLGAKVRHNGDIWESDYDNNSWEPGVFGWHKVNE